MGARPFLLSLMLGAAAAPAWAETAVTVDSVIVTARRDPEDPPVVAQARERLSETPGAVSVIASESYAQRTALALDDMLRDAPGVYAQRKWGGDVRLSIRGSGIGNGSHNRGLILAQDGVPLNEADGFGDSQIADPLNARLTEVYRGGNALRFGGAALGGAINMVTPTGRDAGFEQEVRLDAGSGGLARQRLALARAWGDWDLYAAATNQTGQGDRPQSQQNLQFGVLSVGRGFGEGREMRLIVNAANVAQEIPGALTAGQYAADPSQAAPANYAGDYGRNQRAARGLLRADWRLAEGLDLQAAVYGVWKDLDHPISQVVDQESRNWGGFARLSWDGTVGGLRADAFGGLWLRLGDLDANNYLNLRGARGALQSRSRQNAQGADLFAEARLFVTERLALVGGAAWGVARRDYRSLAVPGASASFTLSASKDYDWAAPRVGLIWEGEGGAQLFANLTRSVEPPNFSSLSPSGNGFTPVEAQAAWTLEAGARGRRGPLTWDVTAYRAELDKELLQYTPGPGVPAATFNAGRTVHQGLEAAVDWRFALGWKLRQSWTWSDFRFQGDRQYGDNRLPVVPEHLYRAELRRDLARGFVAPSVEWASRGAWVDYSNTLRAPGYVVVNLNAGWQATEAVMVFVDLRNLADVDYVSNVQAAVLASAATAAYWPGSGRSVYGGLTWRF